MSNISTLFFDVGGVLLTNGWDHVSREAAAAAFGYNYEDAEERHQQHAEGFECGRISLEEYLNKVIFIEPRAFTPEEYVHFMETQSQPYSENLQLLSKLSRPWKYQLITINNESLALNEYRIKTYHLHDSISLFFSSCYMGVMKPDCKIFQQALWITRLKGDQCLFVDDRKENVEAAQSCGIQAAWVETPSDLPAVLSNAGISF